MLRRTPRGLRNNNPGNIIATPINWRGEVTRTDGHFEQYVDMAHGYRALMVNLRSYIRKGCITLKDIIYRWAPPSQNNTEAYIRAVSKHTGYTRLQEIKADREHLTALAAAISYVENGVPAVMEDVEAGWKIM